MLMLNISELLIDVMLSLRLQEEVSLLRDVAEMFERHVQASCVANEICISQLVLTFI